MPILNIIILSLTICIDSFILCLLIKSRNKLNYLLIPSTFSFFQIIFMLGGYFLGDILEDYLQHYLKYIIFLIFSFMGVKMLIDTMINKDKEKTCQFTYKDIILQASLTSFDSMFLGLPLAFNTETFLILVLIIGLTTFSVCLLALLLKNKVNNSLDDNISIIGSIILFLFAFKSLL